MHGTRVGIEGNPLIPFVSELEKVQNSKCPHLKN